MLTMPRKPKRKKTGLGKQLAKLREDLGITQQQAADKVGVLREAWATWELGTRNPSKGHRILIDLLKRGQL